MAWLDVSLGCILIVQGPGVLLKQGMIASEDMQSAD